MQSNHPDLWKQALPTLTPDGHKYDRGSVLVAGGPMECTGAARLAAMAALRAGAGLSTIACPQDALPVYAASLLSVMVRPYGSSKEFAALCSQKRYHACVIGPGHGVGEGTCEAALAALATGKPIVLDADIFSSFAGKRTVLADALHDRAVLTPHEGEFCRLFGGTLSDNAEREQRCREAAQQMGAVIVLKGQHTLIASPDGQMVINHDAPPWLATAGSGDVLAGITAALLAVGMPSFDAACAAVWLHSETARTLGPGMVAEDMVAMKMGQLVGC